MTAHEFEHFAPRSGAGKLARRFLRTPG